MVYYAEAHHPDLVFYLRERKSPTLEQIFIDVEEIENNLWACGKLPSKKQNEDMDIEERSHFQRNGNGRHTSLKSTIC
jgi:hypothetical protein